jgi:hypothetical protein
MNPEITQFDIIQSKLQQFKKKTPMLIYVITILNIALINFIMICTGSRIPINRSFYVYIYTKIDRENSEKIFSY